MSTDECADIPSPDPRPFLIAERARAGCLALVPARPRSSPSPFSPLPSYRLGVRGAAGLRPGLLYSRRRSCAHFILLSSLTFFSRHFRLSPAFVYDLSIFLLTVKMKFSAALFTVVLTAVTVVSALPFQRRAGAGTTKKMAGTTRLDAAGAVYCENH